MALTLESVVKYVPEFGGERDKKNNRLTFHIRTMGSAPFRIFGTALAKGMKDREDENVLPEAVTELYRKAIAERIAKIENLTIDGKPITDGAAFYDHDAMPHDLVMEIEQALTATNVIDEDASKN